MPDDTSSSATTAPGSTGSSSQPATNRWVRIRSWTKSNWLHIALFVTILVLIFFFLVVPYLKKGSNVSTAKDEVRQADRVFEPVPSEEKRPPAPVQSGSMIPKERPDEVEDRSSPDQDSEEKKRVLNGLLESAGNIVLPPPQLNLNIIDARELLGGGFIVRHSRGRFSEYSDLAKAFGVDDFPPLPSPPDRGLMAKELAQQMYDGPFGTAVKQHSEDIQILKKGQDDLASGLKKYQDETATRLGEVEKRLEGAQAAVDGVKQDQQRLSTKVDQLSSSLQAGFDVLSKKMDDKAGAVGLSITPVDTSKQSSKTGVSAGTGGPGGHDQDPVTVQDSDPSDPPDGQDKLPASKPEPKQ